MRSGDQSPSTSSGLWTDAVAAASPRNLRCRTDHRRSGMARRLCLDEAVDLFLDHCKVERGLARHTLDGYGRDLARFVAFATERGRADADDLTPLDVTDHLLALAERGLSARRRPGA